MWDGAKGWPSALCWLKAWGVVLASSANTGEVSASSLAEPLDGVPVPCAAVSFNACFERLLCLFIPKGIEKRSAKVRGAQ
jgi:hypothetical protein